ncbi:MAG: T9SS type A sorting domain-containing protein [Bacteroidota bacterium]|nr:T9SS type A sorting domain-containing protein [Bacteroidota bacterium]
MKKTIIFLIIHLTILSSAFSQQWNDINPNPPHMVGLLGWAYFTSENTGYILVSDTSSKQWYYKTNNKGSNWFPIRQDGYNVLIFISEDTVIGLKRDNSNKNIYLITNGFDSVELVYTNPKGFVSQWTDENITKGWGDDIYASYDKHFFSPDSIGTYKSKDLGKSWIKVSDTAIYRIGFISDSIAFGQGFFYNQLDKFLVKSNDGGNSWQKTDGKHGADYYFGKDTFYITYRWAIKRSDDGGKTWKAISNGLPASLSPDDVYTFIDSKTGFIYNTFYGLYKTIDAGENWTKLRNPLPYMLNNIQCIAENGKVYFIISELLASGLAKIYHGTYDSTQIWNSTKEIIPKDISEKFKVYPNPAQSKITITYTGFIAFDTKVRIYDIQGKLVKEQQLALEKTVIDIKDFSKGIYFVKIKDGDGVFVEKVVKN